MSFNKVLVMRELIYLSARNGKNIPGSNSQNKTKIPASFQTLYLVTKNLRLSV